MRGSSIKVTSIKGLLAQTLYFKIRLSQRKSKLILISTSKSKKIKRTNFLIAMKITPKPRTSILNNQKPTTKQIKT
jgi:hypothetical protein